MIKNIICAQGAAYCGTIATADLVGHMTEGMLARYQALPFVPTHAFIAAFPYYKKEPPFAGSIIIRKNGKLLGRQVGGVTFDSVGRAALFSQGADYVTANRKRLESACAVLKSLYPDNIFVASGNAWPLPAVKAASFSGIGSIGGNGVLLTENYGSLITIGAILTDLPLEPSGGNASEDTCRHCDLCVKACPQNALSKKDGKAYLTKERCLSYMSQEPILDEYQTIALSASPYLIGCDICQLVCPKNSSPKETYLPEYGQGILNKLPCTSQRKIRKFALVKRNLELQLEYVQKTVISSS